VKGPLALFIFVYLSTPLAEASSFFNKHAEGWHWYEDKPEESDLKDQEQPPLTPTQAIEAQRKELETKLHAAIVAPTRENLVTYLLAQRALMDQSETFSNEWKRVVMTMPSLDETLLHPVDQNARSVYYDKQRKTLETQIKALSNEYGLFFVFKGNCAYCHRFAPIVKRFANRYGWSVLGISLDGGKIAEFPKAKNDNGIAGHLQITHVPALIAIHPQKGHIIPLAYGMVSESEIEARILLLTKSQEKPWR
jgi:conjugal transfer pilus assembly protein TraF